MDIKQLEVFLSVSKFLNFTKAANELYMTQPAVSHQITELEHEIGAKLFQRSSHHVALTAEGEEFSQHALKIVSQARKARSRVNDIRNGKTGHLRILTVQGSLEAAKQCISVFAKRYPDIRIEADVVTGAQQIEAIKHNESDIVFGFSSLINDFPEMDYKLLRKKQYSLLLPAGSPSDIDTDDLTVFREVPLISELDTEAPYLVGEVLRICNRRGLEPVNINWVGSAISLLLAVNCGLGFAIIPTSGKGSFTDDLVMVPIKGDDAVVDDTIGWKETTENAAVRYFLEVAEEIFLKEPVPETKKE